MFQIPANTPPPPPPPPPPPYPKQLNPHAQPYTPYPSTPALCPQPPQQIFKQQTPPPLLLPGLKPVYFSYNPVFVYQPKVLWPPIFPQKLEQYNAFSQPKQEKSKSPYPLKELSGCSTSRDDHMNIVNKGTVKRFISPTCRPPPRKVESHKKWALKISSEKTGAAHAADYDSILKGNTSLMIRNIPNHFDRRDLIRILDKHCRNENSKAKLISDPCRSEYDFVYLPMDFGYKTITSPTSHSFFAYDDHFSYFVVSFVSFCSNLGYAFVNFTTCAAALRFCVAFDQYQWEVSAPGQKKKICEITCATIQGKEGLVKNFEKSKFSCHTRRYLPVTLSPPRDGWNDTAPSLIGKCVGVGAAPPVNLRKVRLLMRKKGMVN
ncbi:hypothetical protein EZV62_022078 [Acer yangbiense]|uniref:Mei2-like C-terminal RNA recognition motif domain-containing protein n=1 Tax=Acer yangbiense TaxID=1000413 RepID=A0A5C7H872_9ROSI|nr:hypothetical protein EZV62_022078 [Acer yangbiense]